MATTVHFIQRALSFAHRALADARNGTDEQLHFVPSGGSHSIAWCLWHTARIEDLIINMRSRGAPQVWNEEWANRIGLPYEGTGNGQSDSDALGIHIKDMDAFREYQEAVWAETASYLESATDAELDREVPTRGGGTESIGEGISLHLIGHFNGHRGEINLLRGMQGMPTVLVSEGTH
jgi:uncharacterized damage-inducible protein DinB